MKLPLSLLVYAITGFLASAAVAGQPGGEVEWGQKARPDPGASPQPVFVAQANTGQQIAARDELILGICNVVNINGYPQADADPVILANAYFRTHDKTIDPGTAKITTLQQPKHGSLEPDSGGDWRYAKYLPNDGYLGDDSFVMQVEGSGYTVKLKYFIAVTEDKGMTLNPNPVCKGQIWKISQDANGTPTLTLSAINYQSPTIDAGATTTDTAALASTLESKNRQPHRGQVLHYDIGQRDRQ